MCRRTILTLTTMALFLAVALPAGNAVAQQKQQVSFKAAAEDSKYAQQQNVDVGDVPNHIVRIFDLHITFPNNAPVINGLKLADQWTRGTADLTDGNGTTTLYNVFVMENGDRFFARGNNVLQNISGKVAITGIGYITGGTGKFVAIQGILRTSSNIDFKTNFVETQNTIEYSIGK